MLGQEEDPSGCGEKLSLLGHMAAGPGFWDLDLPGTHPAEYEWGKWD